MACDNKPSSKTRDLALTSFLDRVIKSFGLTKKDKKALKKVLAKLMIQE